MLTALVAIACYAVRRRLRDSRQRGIANRQSETGTTI
jgi:hypothetical protein